MTNLYLRRLLVISFLLSTCMLRSMAQSEPPCAVSCAHSAASQAGCDTYKVACFCGSSQFLSTAEGCIQETCAGSAIHDATDFIENLCTMSSASSVATSSSRPFATASASNNAVASLTRDIALLGFGALGAVVAAIT